MELTTIDFQEDEVMYQGLIDGLKTVVDNRTVHKGSFVKKKIVKDMYSEQMNTVYDHYEISLETKGKAMLGVKIRGDFSTRLNLEETRSAIDELTDFAVSYLKENKVNTYLSVSFICFCADEVEMEEIFGPERFADFERTNYAIPLSEELKELQVLAILLNEHFPVRYNGKTIESGYGKFRKMQELDVVNEDGKAKIGVFRDELLCTVADRKEMRELIKMKETKKKELEKVKQNAINTLKKLDPTFLYDGKNGVVLFGQKLTINTEYNVFTKEYLMLFLKSKIKTKTLVEMENKVDKFIKKKTA